MARTYVGLDVGSKTVKAVELRRLRDGFRIERFAVVPMPAGGLVEGVVVDSGKVSEAVRAAFQQAGIHHRRVVTALGSKAVVVREIQLPEMPEEELDRAVRFEAERYLPVAGEDLRVDYQVVEGAHGQVSVLFAAARREVVDNFVQALEGAGVTPEVLEVTTFALARLFRGDAQQGAIMVADMGAEGTDLLVLQGDRLRLSRMIPTGGNVLTRAVAAVLELEPAAAEVVKEEKAVAPVGRTLPEDPTSARVAEAISPVLGDLVTETRRSMEFFVARSGGQEIRKVVLTGGSSRMPNLAAFLAEELGVPVEVGDAFRIAPADPRAEGLGPVVAVATGLALRGAEG
jgi:type IV pilus assembly protein PilM